MSLKELESKLNSLSIEKEEKVSVKGAKVTASVDNTNPFDLDLTILGGSRPRMLQTM